MHVTGVFKGSYTDLYEIDEHVSKVHFYLFIKEATIPLLSENIFNFHVRIPLYPSMPFATC